jgi:hypothetical protein
MTRAKEHPPAGEHIDCYRDHGTGKNLYLDVTSRYPHHLHQNHQHGPLYNPKFSTTKIK